MATGTVDHHTGASSLQQQMQQVGLVDVSSLTRLNDTIYQAQNNTKSILSRLKDFEHRLSRLDQQILPIQSSTTRLSNAKKNIGLTFIEIEKTHDYFRLANDSGAVITKGLKDNFDNFFEVLEKVTNAKKFFEENKDMRSTANALHNIDHMLKKALAQCNEEVERYYKSFGKTYEASTSPHTPAHAPAPADYQPINPVPDEAVPKIRIICEYLERNAFRSHLTMYQTLRLQIIKSELKSHEPSTSSLSELINDDKLYIKGKLFFIPYYHLAYAMLRGEVDLLNITVPFPSKERTDIYVNTCQVIINEMGKVLAPLLASYGQASTLLKKESLGPSSHKASMLFKLSNQYLIRLEVLDVFMSNFLEFSDLCTLDQHGDDDNAGESKGGRENPHLSSLRDAIAKSCLLAYDELYQHLTGSGGAPGSHHDAAAALPQSGDLELHPFTTAILRLCKEIVLYDQPYQLSLGIAYEMNTNMAPYPTSILAVEVALIEQLLIRLNLTADEPPPILKSSSSSSFRSEGGVDMRQTVANGLGNTRKYLFSLNNLDAISTHLKGKVATLQAASPAVDDRKRKTSFSLETSLAAGLHDLLTLLSKVEARINSEVKQLSSILAELVNHCLKLNGEDAPVIKGSTMNFGKSKEDFQLHKQLKACFREFNETMDGLAEFKGTWKMPSEDIKEKTMSTLHSDILAVYTAFFDKYKTVPFSKKNTASYLRYPPNMVASILNALFS